MSKTASVRTAAPRRRGGETLVQMYGWDARTCTWHGPNEVTAEESRPGGMLESLRGAHGPSWYGHIQCCSSRFFTVIHRAADCATAMIYCSESKTGPVEIVAVLPAELRSVLRSDFAFEFLSFARYLGSISAESELRLHEAITTAIAEADEGHSLVLSLASGLWSSDDDHTLSACVEKIAATLLAWMGER